MPLGRVAVAVEQHALVLAQRVDHDLVDRGLEALLALLRLDLLDEERQRLGDDRVQHGVRLRSRLRAADGAELELVAGECERRRAVAVRRVARQRRQRRHAEAHRVLALLGLRRGARDDVVDDVGELLAEVDRDDRRRRFIRTEAMVVASVRDRAAQQVRVHIDRAHHRREEHDEPQVRLRRVAGVEQVVAGVGRERPVVVLARAVDARERLLVQQALEAVLLRHLLQHFHAEHVVVGSDRRALEDRRDLVLLRRNFVVSRLHRHAELPQLVLALLHVGQHARLDRTEVVVFELLALRRLRAEQRAAGRDQIGTTQVEVAVDEEVLLLASQRRIDVARLLVAEHAEHAQRLTADGLEAAQERRLLVEGLARPRAERGRDAQRRAVRRLAQERGRRWIPRGVAARFERGAQAAARERARIRLALDQRLAVELHQQVAVLEIGERVVLLGGRARHGLEPVREVRGTAFDRPLLHRVRDLVGEARTELLALRHAKLQRLVGCFREPGAHLLRAEDIGSEQFGDARVAAGKRNGFLLGDRADRGSSLCIHVCSPRLQSVENGVGTPASTGSKGEDTTHRNPEVPMADAREESRPAPRTRP